MGTKMGINYKVNEFFKSMTPCRGGSASEFHQIIFLVGKRHLYQCSYSRTKQGCWFYQCNEMLRSIQMLHFSEVEH